MAVEVGFEPTEDLRLHTLSRRAPSATRRLHRRRAYRTWPVSLPRCQAASGGGPALGEEVAQQGTALVGEHAAQNLGPVRQPPGRAGTCCATGACRTGPRFWAACSPTSAVPCCATSSPSAGPPPEAA